MQPVDKWLFNLPPKNTHFTGREELLTRIAQYLVQSSPQEPVILTACYGLGGVGKTQLAIEYAYRHLHAHTAVFWINAETAEQIELTFYQLAQVLKLEVQASQAMISMIKRWWETHPGYLVIFDNVDDYAQIEPYLPRLNGQVLITSRHIQWPNEGIVVDVFSQEDAKAYVEKILGAAKSHEAEPLAQTLGYLPLALAQACAFIKQNHITIAKYLEWYQTKRAALLKSEVLPPGDKHLPVYVNWEMTLKVIREKLKHDKGEKLLTFCAYLQHTGVPKQLLLNYLEEHQLTDELEQIKLLAVLVNYSLLHEDKTPDCYTLHPVMQEVMKLSHDETMKAAQIQALIRQLTKLYPYGKDTLDDLQAKRLLLPHLECVLKQLNQNNLKQEQDILWLLIRLADGYEDIGDAKQAKISLERVLAIEEKYYGKNHLQLASTLASLGVAYAGLGDTKQQKALLERALVIEEKYYGRNHLEVANTLGSLGTAYGALGNAKQAKVLLEEALAIQEKHYGKNHPQVAPTLTNLGIAYGILGDAKQKQILLEQALAIQEKCYEKNHPSIAVILSNLGNAHGNLGDIQRKIALLKQALTIQEKHYGKDHPRIADILASLGAAYGELGDTKQQKALLEQALTIQEKYYGKDQLQVASTLASLGTAYGDLGDAKQQKALLERALAIKEKYYGKDHPQVANTLANLGAAYEALGDAEQAKILLEQSLAIEEKYYEKDHPQLAITLVYLSKAYGALGDAKQQKVYLEWALAIEKKYYGPDHPRLATTLANLGYAYFKLQNIEQAVTLARQAHTIFQKHYGDNHRYTQITKYNLERYQIELMNYRPS